MDVTIEQRLTTRCGRALAISLFALCVLPSRGSAMRGSYSTLRIPFQIDGQDVAGEMYLRVREKRYNRKMSSLSVRRGDREDAFARRIWKSIRSGNVSEYSSLWRRGLRNKAKGIFPYRTEAFDTVGSDHIGWRYDVGNVTYFAIDDHPHGG